MDNYLTEVYLKRMNKAGKTRQDRIKTRKEREFDRLFLKDSEYLATLYQIDEKEVNCKCSLQPSKWNESNLYSNLLMSTSDRLLEVGQILRIKWTIKDVTQDKIWLVVFVENNLTKGYQSFKIICLDTAINITDEYGTTVYSTPVKITNAAQSFMQDTMIKTASEPGYREPQTTHIAITKDSDQLVKGTYFNFSNRGWEIVGIDNISVPKVAYLYLSERMVVEPEPISSENIPVGEDDNFFLIGR